MREEGQGPTHTGLRGTKQVDKFFLWSWGLLLMEDPEHWLQDLEGWEVMKQGMDILVGICSSTYPELI